MKSDTLSHIFRDYIQSSFALGDERCCCMEYEILRVIIALDQVLQPETIKFVTCYAVCHLKFSTRWVYDVRSLQCLRRTSRAHCGSSSNLCSPFPTEFVGLRTRVRPVLFTLEDAGVFPWLRLTVGLKYFFYRGRLSR